MKLSITSWGVGRGACHAECAILGRVCQPQCGHAVGELTRVPPNVAFNMCFVCAVCDIIVRLLLQVVASGCCFMLLLQVVASAR